MALTFQTRLESVEWKVEGDKFECRLTQPIAHFGYGEFVRRAGEPLTFRLKASAPLARAGSATVIAAAAPWQPGRGDINLGAARLTSGEVTLNASQAGSLFDGMLNGRSAVVRHDSGGGQVMEVRLLPVKFDKAYSDYQACTDKLLPVNFEQIKQAQIAFPHGGWELDADAKSRLQVLIDFLKEDPSINHIELAGHSDNSASRLTNRDVSRRRGLAAMEYLKAHGFPETQMTLRFYGESYPLVPNNSAANRAKNRRVTIILKRLAPVEKPSPPAADPAPGPATATTS
jgi:outer membrane protein OmpA-like peptidoglycan-associated protein